MLIFWSSFSPQTKKKILPDALPRLDLDRFWMSVGTPGKAGATSEEAEHELLGSYWPQVMLIRLNKHFSTEYILTGLCKIKNRKIDVYWACSRNAIWWTIQYITLTLWLEVLLKKASNLKSLWKLRFLTFKTHVESELLPVAPRGQMYEYVSSVHTTTLVISHLRVTSGKDNMLSFQTFSYGYCRHNKAWRTSTIQGQLTTVTRHNVNRQKLRGLYIYCDSFTYQKITSPKAARNTTAVQTHLHVAFINPLIIRPESQSYKCFTSKLKPNFYPHLHILTSPR